MQQHKAQGETTRIPARLPLPAAEGIDCSWLINPGRTMVKRRCVLALFLAPLVADGFLMLPALHRRCVLPPTSECSLAMPLTEARNCPILAPRHASLAAKKGIDPFDPRNSFAQVSPQETTQGGGYLRLSWTANCRPLRCRLAPQPPRSSFSWLAEI